MTRHHQSPKSRAESLRSEGQRALCVVPDSLNAASKRLRVGRSTVSDWRRGVRIPSREHMERIRRVYGIPETAWGARVDRRGMWSHVELAEIVESTIESKPAIEPMPPRKRNDVKGMWKCSSAAEREAALKMANEGVPIKNIAIALGRSAPTITAWCKAGGWKRCKVERPPVVVAIEIGEAPQAPEDGDGAVYFLAAEDVDRVKVGFTRDRTTIVKRMSSLAYSSPVPVTLMKVIAGSMQGERWLHAKWAEHRHHGEWFTLSAIRADIEAMESVRDASAEVEAAKACADCGIYRRGAKRGQVRCRACARKRVNEEKAALREATRVRLTEARCPCGTELSKSNTSGLCKPCAMRKVWGTDEYREKMMQRDVYTRSRRIGRHAKGARQTTG